MIAERLKVFRALPFKTPQRKLRLIMSDQDIDFRQRETDPVSSAPESERGEPTRPLPAMPPPRRARMTAEELRGHPGFNEDDFGCVSALAIVEGQEEVKRAAGSLAEFDRNLERRLRDQVTAIDASLATNYGLVKAEVVALQKEHEAFRAELASLKAKIEALEPLKEKLAQLERKLLNREENVDAAAPPAASR